jgi:hypothetical protein
MHETKNIKKFVGSFKIKAVKVCSLYNAIIFKLQYFHHEGHCLGRQCNNNVTHERSHGRIHNERTTHDGRRYGHEIRVTHITYVPSDFCTPDASKMVM